jgi:hypothetical protein
MVSLLFGVISIALFLRGWGYYWGSGPHDGEDLPSFVTFVAGSAALSAAVLIGWSENRGHRKLWLTALSVSGVLLLTTCAWWAVNVILERWAS